MVPKLIGIRLSSLIVAIMVVVSFITINSLMSSFEWVDHTNKVIDKIHKVKDAIADCHISLRETSFTKDKKFYGKYFDRRPMMDSGLDELKTLTIDNKFQQSNIDELRKNIEPRVKLWDAMTHYINDERYSDAQASMIHTFGEPWILNTRIVSDNIENEEKRLLNDRMKDYRGKSSVVLYGLPIMLIFYVVVFNLLNNSVERRVLNN